MDSLLQNLNQALGAQLGEQLPRVGIALFILVAGWIAAKIISGLIKKLLLKTDVDNKLADFLSGKEKSDVDIEGIIGTAVYYIVMLAVIVAVFDKLELPLIAQPLNALLSQVFTYLPRLFAGGIILVFAWLLATGLRILITSGLTKAKVDEKLKLSEEEEELPFAKSVGETVYWGVYLVFLPAVLSALEMQGLLSPVQTMLNQVMGFIPNILGAAMIIGIGWFAARVIERIVTNLLGASGVDSLSEKIGLSAALGKVKLSKTVGMVAYVLILLPAVVGALDALQMDAVTQPVNQLLNTVLGSVPGIFSAVIIVALFHVLGRFVGSLVGKLAGSIGFDKLPSLLGFGASKEEDEAEATTQKSPSYLLGQLVYIAVMVVAVIEASNHIGFKYISQLVQEFAFFATDIFSGVVIVGVGLYLGTLAFTTISSSGLKSSHLLGTLARVAIVFLSGAMGLRRMGLANEIIELAFGLIIGAFALGIAVAFGLGAKDVVGKEVEGWIKATKDAK